MGMQGLTYRFRRWGLDGPSAWMGLALAGAWTLAVLGILLGDINAPIFYLLFLPFPVAAALLLRRRENVPALRASAGWMAILAGALLSSVFLTGNVLVALALPGLFLAAAVTARYPAASVVAVFLLSGCFGSAQAFLGVSVAPAADLLLGGLWIGTIWAYLLSERRRAVWLWPGVAVMALYVALSFFEIFASDDVLVAGQSFRASTWYLAAFLLVALAPWPPGVIRRIATGCAAVAALVGGYATLRWIIGPAAQEYTNAISQTNNNLVNDKFRLIGSFVGGKELALWATTAIPFCLAFALTFRGRRRLLGFAACAVCAVAMFGTDVRVAIVAIVPAVLAVLVLYQLSPAFSGLHLGTTLAALFAMAVIGVGAFAFTIGGESTTAKRYSILLTAPTQDPSYQARVFKWGNAIADIRRHPFGQGLGTAGRTQQRYGRFVNISSIDVDNSYLRIALEQGLGVLAFYVVGLVLLLWGLGRRVLTATDPARAGLAIGAIGVLVAFAIFMFVGTYVEGLPALAAWLLVGLGVAGFVQVEERPEPSRTVARAASAPA